MELMRSGNLRHLGAVTGWAAGAARVEARALRGGLDSRSVVCVTARHADARGRPRVTRFVVKSLGGGAAGREAGVYQRLLAGTAAGGFAPALLAVDRTSDEACDLYLEVIRPAARWPWRDVRFARDVLHALAAVHAVPVSGASAAADLGDWDYEAELIERAGACERLVAELPRAARPPGVSECLPALRRVAAALPAMRAHLLGAGPFGRTLIHGDVHPGNAMIRRRGGRAVPVLLDWGRARIGSPLEDVSSWLQSLGYWEPQARRRHDTLLKAYLSAGPWGGARLDGELRRLYWVAAASNVLAGALMHHLRGATDATQPASRRAGAAAAARDVLRVIRRADACWRTGREG